MEPTESEQSSLFEGQTADEDDGAEQMAPLKLPSANEFAPGQIPDLGLRGALRLVHEHAGDRNAITEAIRAAQFVEAASEKKDDPAARHKQQSTRANNVLIGLSEYGLASLATNELTDKGKELLATDDDDTRYRRFAEHILRECHGIDVIRAMHDIRQREEEPTKARLHRELELRGFNLKRDTTDHLQLRAWLAKAGVTKGWHNSEIDGQRFAELAGFSLDTLDEIASLDQAQVAFLKTLRRLAEATGSEEVEAKTVRDHVELEHGTVIPSGQASKVVEALGEQGWVTTPEKKAGRGGKSGKVAPTEKLLGLNLERLLKITYDGVPADLRPRLNVPLATIRAELDSKDKHTAGIALELLAVRLAYDLALRPAGFRERSKITGGAEVDLIAEAVHLHHTRWLFQCKNTKQVQTSDVAKEVGMAHLLHAHVIVMVTTGRFTAGARQYARSVTAAGPLQVVLVTGNDLRKYLSSGPQSIMSLFRDAATATARLKLDQSTPYHQ